jgi:ribonuclease P protein component
LYKLPVIAKANSLGKDQRLKSRKLIGQLFETGQTMSLPPLRVTYLRATIDRVGELAPEQVSLNKKLKGVTARGVAEPGRPNQLPYSTLVSGQLQAGFGVSTRNFKKATDRNRIKRLLRESYRTSRTTLSEAVTAQPCNLFIFIMYTSREIPLWPSLNLKMKELIGTLTHNIHEPAA